MTVDPDLRHLSPEQHAALFAAAKRRAHALRDEALQDAARAIARALLRGLRRLGEASRSLIRARPVARRGAEATRHTPPAPRRTAATARPKRPSARTA